MKFLLPEKGSTRGGADWDSLILRWLRDIGVQMWCRQLKLKGEAGPRERNVEVVSVWML